MNCWQLAHLDWIFGVIYLCSKVILVVLATSPTRRSCNLGSTGVIVVQEQHSFTWYTNREPFLQQVLGTTPPQSRVARTARKAGQLIASRAVNTFASSLASSRNSAPICESVSVWDSESGWVCGSQSGRFCMCCIESSSTRISEVRSRILGTPVWNLLLDPNKTVGPSAVDETHFPNVGLRNGVYLCFVFLQP